MWHTQRLQIGMALVAILFCLTSVTTVVGNSHVQASAQSNIASTFTQVSRTDLRDTASLAIYSIGVPKPVAEVGLQSPSSLRSLVESVNHARSTIGQHGKERWLLVFRNRQHQVLRVLQVSDAFTFRDALTRTDYAADTTLRTFLLRFACINAKPRLMKATQPLHEMTGLEKG